LPKQNIKLSERVLHLLREKYQGMEELFVSNNWKAGQNRPDFELVDFVVERMRHHRRNGLPCVTAELCDLLLQSHSIVRELFVSTNLHGVDSTRRQAGHEHLLNEVIRKGKEAGAILNKCVQNAEQMLLRKHALIGTTFHPASKWWQIITSAW
jgi:hypothetical protein